MDDIVDQNDISYQFPPFSCENKIFHFFIFLLLLLHVRNMAGGGFAFEDVYNTLVFVLAIWVAGKATVRLEMPALGFLFVFCHFC